MTSTVYPWGQADFTVANGHELKVFSQGEDSASVYYGINLPNFPISYDFQADVGNEETLFGPMAADTLVRIIARADKVLYDHGATATISVPAPAAAASSDPISYTGLAAAQGGEVEITGGTSSTSANDGGAVTITGGTPGATGAGGAVNIATGDGGATSGAGGNMLITTGTATAASASGNIIISSGAGADSGAAVAAGASGGVILATNNGGANTGGATGQVGGAAGDLSLTSGSGGLTTSTGAHAGGAAGDVIITAGDGGDANAGTGDGGKGGIITLTPGTGGATTGGTAGVDGVIIARGVLLVKQGAAAAKTVSATLTAAELLTGEITVNQGGGAPSALQLPLATAVDTALPDSAAGDAFDFSLTNISAVAAETASITTNTGWTLVGNMLLAANTAVTDISQGIFRAKKTGAGAWTLTRRA